MLFGYSSLVLHTHTHTHTHTPYACQSSTYPCQVPVLSDPFVIGILSETPTIPLFKCPGYRWAIEWDQVHFLYHASSYHIIRAFVIVFIRPVFWNNSVQPHGHISLHCGIRILIKHKAGWCMLHYWNASALHKKGLWEGYLQNTLAMPTLNCLISGTWLTISSWTRWQPEWDNEFQCERGRHMVI